MAPHSSTLAWKIPWTEEPGRLRFMGSLELDTTERLHFHFSLSCIGEGNGNPLQCSCLENPRDGEAWWAAIYGVAQSQTRLKQLSSSSSSSPLFDWKLIFLVLSCMSCLYILEINYLSVSFAIIFSHSEGCLFILLIVSFALQSVALNTSANLENSSVATGLEKVSFHSNPKERQCQRMHKLLHNCTRLTH